jgi:hypothetical protein
MAAKSPNTADLLAELAKNAAEFNQATDSINSLIERFEETLRNLHLGIETWLVSYPLKSDESKVDYVEDPGAIERGELAVNTQLGFTKRAGEWGLAVRVVVYRREGTLGREFLHANPEVPLRDASRALRIEALEHFPQLLHRLNEQVKDGIKKIQAAREFVELC